MGAVTLKTRTYEVTELEGFEPSVELQTPHLISNQAPSATRSQLLCEKTEAEGFEPPDLSTCGFQDRRLKPLGHASIGGHRQLVHPMDGVKGIRTTRVSRSHSLDCTLAVATLHDPGHR